MTVFQSAFFISMVQRTILSLKYCANAMTQHIVREVRNIRSDSGFAKA